MTPTVTNLLKSPTLMLALGFGSGLVKKGPGTAGSLVGLLVYCVMAQLSPAIYVGLVALGFGGGIWICGRAAAQLQIKDPGCIVWDEIIGMLIACWLVPLEPA
ncbi:MAG: phosphatidylglycerophosphatase A, partial [Gammaproteobacteria bacterium]|nr:phosphatidylglycerophosphatase A [Gammaproteobacteria bacterium]